MSAMNISDTISAGYEKEHPLWRQKCEQKLHHVKDRAELIADCTKAGDELERNAGHIALEALKYEETGDFEDALRCRRAALYEYGFARRFRALAYGLAPLRYDDRPRMAPYEEDAMKLVDEVWSSASVEEWQRGWEETARQRAQHMIDTVMIARFLVDDVGRDLAASDVQAVMKLPSDQREQLRWLFVPNEKDRFYMKRLDRPCDCEGALKASFDRLQEWVRCAGCSSEYRGTKGLRVRLDIARIFRESLARNLTSEASKASHTSKPVV